MSSPAILLPNAALPLALRAGDSYTSTVQTQLAPGTAVFFTLTAVVANIVVRVYIGSPRSIDPTAILIDDTGTAAFSVPSSTTSAWTPGSYRWEFFAVDSSGNRTQVATGTTLVTPDPAGANPADPRSYNQRMLEAIRAVRAGAVTENVLSYKIGTRELVHLNPKELRDLEAEFEARYRRERIRRGEKVPSKTVGIAFRGGF